MADMQRDLPNLTDRAAALLVAAKKAGADAGDAAISRSRSYSIDVRMGKTEQTESAETDNFSLRVFVGKRVAAISADLSARPDELAERAVAQARVSPESPFEGEVEAPLLAKTRRELDLLDAFTPDMVRLSDDAAALEAAALAVKGVTNSGGASAWYGAGGLVLVTSQGFSGSYLASHFGRSVSVVAGAGAKLERDYAYSSARHYADMAEIAALGDQAGRQAVARLGARPAPTGQVDVVFAPRVARSLAGHLSAMVNGAAIARKTGLLRNFMGKRLMRKGQAVSDNPLRPRGPASRPFDGEGVEPVPLALVEDGILQDWLLSSSAAKELGLETNGRGVRSGNAIVPGATNFAIEAGETKPEDLIGSLKTGFYVTELIGRGVDLVTGQYSRGAAGFWIENGVPVYPVSEVSLGSDLLHMFAHMTAADDLDRHYAVTAPTLLVEGMMLAGA
ncbi:MAG: TldD/PmbA family protein [Candidatus Tokpelaia sp.]|nr:MAG: TldD/PmbA family protein [Candidatus Tokpelaia sp.]KAA6207492.1 MAG: TldD/PmbA family protein [Candidatus Tokpelaia sp.]